MSEYERFADAMNMKTQKNRITIGDGKTMKGVKYEKPLKFKLDIQSFASKPKKRDTIWLESDEWSRVKSELNTHLNHKKLKKR